MRSISISSPWINTFQLWGFQLTLSPYNRIDLYEVYHWLTCNTLRVFFHCKCCPWKEYSRSVELHNQRDTDHVFRPTKNLAGLQCTKALICYIKNMECFEAAKHYLNPISIVSWSARLLIWLSFIGERQQGIVHGGSPAMFQTRSLNLKWRACGFVSFH